MRLSPGPNHLIRRALAYTWAGARGKGAAKWRELNHRSRKRQRQRRAPTRRWQICPARNDEGSISTLSHGGSGTAQARIRDPLPLRREPATAPDCKFKHLTAYVAQAPACRDGWHCTRPGCGFTPPARRARDGRLPFAARHVLLAPAVAWTGDTAPRPRRIAQPAAVRTRNGRAVDVKAASASALEHAREYFEWERSPCVRGSVVIKTAWITSGVWTGRDAEVGALTREKRRRLGRKLTKGEKREVQARGGRVQVAREPRRSP